MAMANPKPCSTCTILVMDTDVLARCITGRVRDVNTDVLDVKDTYSVKDTDVLDAITWTVRSYS